MPTPDPVRSGLDEIRAELGVPTDFPPEVLEEADAAVKSPRLPDADRTDLELVTIDPPESRDLDQALALERRDGGYRVWYAIADLTAFVTPGGALDREVHARAVTVYAPDGSTPLHPPVLAHGAASLLPDQDSPAALWCIDLDATGTVTSTEVRRAMVRSRAKLDYATVQRDLDVGTAAESLQLLREVGRLREERERARGAVSLPVPEQQLEEVPGGAWRLVYRAPLDVEGWNAQISLLTGIAAADLMLAGQVGLLRTLPPPVAEAVADLRRSAVALAVDWPTEQPYADLIRSLDAANPAHAALLSVAGRLLRGAGYVAFDGAPPAETMHSALATPYAHTTAPLRRLGDRYVLATCEALCAGREVPEWVRAALPALPDELAGGIRRASAVERAALDLAEAVLLEPRVDEEFDAVVVTAEADGGTVQVRDPAVRARCRGKNLPLGERLRVRLVSVDVPKRNVLFEPA